jgi:AcrR family transcriptional regulator
MVLTVTVPVSLRVRQAELARQAILEAAGDVLLHGDPDAVSLAVLAETAGVSARTLYRYFPTRGELMGAALAHLNETLELRPEIDTDDFASTVLAAAQRMASYPQLVHNLRHTTAGREARAAYRTTRAQELIGVVASMAPSTLDPDAVRGAAGVIAFLSGSTAWTAVHDEADLEVPAAQRAVVERHAR